MRLIRIFSSVVLLLVTQIPSIAQQSDAIISFGGLRVPACAASADAGYGLTAARPIQLGGGPVYADSRLNRFIGALRGTKGEMLRITGRGSAPAPIGYMDEPTILDFYQIAVGDQTITLVVDDYHYSIPKAPMGLTCAGPLVTALGVPPLDPMVLSRSIMSVAVEEGTAHELPGIPLDVSTPRGFLFDQFLMIAQRAHEAANMGTPLDLKKLPADIDPAGLVVLAFPLPCADRTITPMRVEVSGPQGSVAQNGGVIKDDALAKMFPGRKLPADSIGVRFRQSQVSGLKIVYSEACNATPAEVPLLVRVDTPRSPLRPIPLPAGVVEAEPAIFLQVIVDPLGAFAGAVYIGGPKSLLPAALEAIGKMRTDPIRLNGVGIDNPAVIPIVFQ